MQFTIFLMQKRRKKDVFFTLNMTKGGSRFPSAVQERMTVQWLDSIPGCLKFGCGGIGFGGGGSLVVVLVFLVAVAQWWCWLSGGGGSVLVLALWWLRWSWWLVLVLVVIMEVLA